MDDSVSLVSPVLRRAMVRPFGCFITLVNERGGGERGDHSAVSSVLSTRVGEGGGKGEEGGRGKGEEVFIQYYTATIRIIYTLR